MKSVVDADVLIAAYTAEERLGEHWQPDLGSASLVISPEIFIEVEKALRQTTFGLQGAEIRSILLAILNRCEVVRPRGQYEGDVEDERQRHLVQLATEAEADSIVSGDTALQSLRTLGGFPLLSPGAFFDATPETA